MSSAIEKLNSKYIAELLKKRAIESQYESVKKQLKNSENEIEKIEFAIAELLNVNDQKNETD